MLYTVQFEEICVPIVSVLSNTVVNYKRDQVLKYCAIVLDLKYNDLSL